MRYVIIPGIGGSDEEHWQSLWQAEWGSAAVRITPASWDEPDLADWCTAIGHAVGRAGPGDVVLVAHSLGCLAAAAWVTRHPAAAGGVFLVAPPDDTAPAFPAAAGTFTGLAPEPLGIPGLVVAGENDPYSPDAGRGWSAARRLDRISAGHSGHLNSASRLGRWDFGRALLTAFTAGLGTTG
ncbi:alpha/beta hydrolase [Amycolatopsis sp. NPDC051045]|uniref:RBBP9/YdeN family alpha/beta hydrolase n=1 Tax=Amycolatopsis sp. NPDC051045 TaxID=3156922 RepID=UPI003428EDCB